MNSSGRGQVQGQMFREDVPTFDFNYKRRYNISDILLFSKQLRPALGSIQPPIQWLQSSLVGLCSEGVTVTNQILLATKFKTSGTTHPSLHPICAITM